MKSTLAVAGTVTALSIDWNDALAVSSVDMAPLFPGDDGAFKLPPLPYSYNALEPYIDARTMEIHYTKHHQAYIDKLNAAIAKAPDQQGKSIEQLLSSINSLPDAVKMQIRNQGGGHWNHSFFWQILAPKSDVVAPSGRLMEAIAQQWQSFDNFKTEFNKAGTGVFGSGWAGWFLTRMENFPSLQLRIRTTRSWMWLQIKASPSWVWMYGNMHTTSSTRTSAANILMTSGM